MRSRLPPVDGLGLVCAGVIAAALFCGGGTRQGFLGDVVVQVAAVPLLLAGLWRLATRPEALGPGTRPALVALIGLGSWTLLQLVPWPPQIWPPEIWPREITSTGGQLRPTVDTLPPGQTGTISLTPQATWAALTSLLPPVAVFIAAIQFPAPARQRIALMILVFGCASLLLGFLQVAQGPASPLRFFAITNVSDAVGFFANRNHFAALLYITLVLAASWALMAGQRSLGGARLDAPQLFSLAVAGAIVIGVIAGLVTARSRAGVLLAMAAVVMIAGLALRTTATTPDQPGGRRYVTPQRLVLALLGFAVVFAAQFGLHRFAGGLDRNLLEDPRVFFTVRTLDAAWQSLPFGTGLGSFAPVYAVHERTSDLFSEFANRAHNDFAEFFLETGLVGLLLLAVAFAWLGQRIWLAWRTPEPARSRQEVLLERACSIAIVLVLAHSVVDYPLRTTAIATVFAFFCAVLTRPSARTEPDLRDEPATAAPSPPPRRRRGRRQPPAPTVAPDSAWLSEINWPDEWQRPQRRPKTDDDP